MQDKISFCPECSIGLNNQEQQLEFCKNCHATWDSEDFKEENKEY